jgi:signal transduction histidine kinase
MGSNRGISRVSRRELNEFADGKIASIRSRAFGIRDGLTTLECNGGRQPSGLKTADGRLWFPTMGGVATVDPVAVPASGPPPPVIIEELFVQGRPVVLAPEVTVPYDSNSIEIRYTAAAFSAPEQVRFRHRLIGLDEEWIDAGRNRTAAYYRVPPGRYQFAVTAAGEEGVWSGESRTVTFVVLSPLWRQAWFLGVLLIATIVMAVVLDRRRVRRHRREQEIQAAFARRLIDAQEAERQRISTELHDSLGQDLFIIRAHLKTARLAAEEAGALGDTLETIDGAARRASDDLRTIAHALRPYHLDKIGLATSIRSMVASVAQASGIPFTTAIEAIDDLLDLDRQVAVFRIAQEAANNVVKHSGATSARVGLRVKEGAVELHVSDNGRGIDPSSLDAPDRSQGGLGLRTIRERARGLGGEAVVQSSAGKGTTIVVTLPLKGRDG